MSRRGEMRDAVSCALDSEKVTNITRSQSPDPDLQFNSFHKLVFTL